MTNSESELAKELTVEQIERVLENFAGDYEQQAIGLVGAKFKEWMHKQPVYLALQALSANKGERVEPVALQFAMYSDEDECMGNTIEEYVQNRTFDLTDELELQPGQEFYVDACYYRTEKWRLLARPTEANPNEVIKCERVDAHPADSEYRRGVEDAAKYAARYFDGHAIYASSGERMDGTALEDSINALIPAQRQEGGG